MKSQHSTNPNDLIKKRQQEAEAKRQISLTSLTPNR
jgi:hypothetical protein